MNCIETERLLLRKAKMGDLEKIFKNVWSVKKLTKYMLWEVSKTKEEAKERLNNTIKYQKNNYAYFICLKETDEPIGFVGIKEVSKNVYADTGLCISLNNQNKGLGKEVLKALLDFVFYNLNGEKFIYSCMRENVNSKKLCESFNFIYYKSEHKIRDYDRMEYIDDNYYLLKEDYNLKKENYE